MKGKLLIGLVTFYGIYELRKFYIRVKTRILFEQLWEHILIQQEMNPIEFRKMIDNYIRPPVD